MAFTYNLGVTNATALLISKVRLLIPDNVSTAYELEDDEIQYFLDEYGNDVKAAAAGCCEQLSRMYAQRATFTADGFSIQHSQRAELWAKRAAELSSSVGGAVSSVTLTREDGYSDASADSDYETSTVYIKVG